MKVAHVSYGFFPDAPGGTEIYVHGLARELALLGIEGVVLAPADSMRSYTHDGIPVRRFAGAEHLDLASLYGEGDEQAATEFGAVLEQEKPDVVHLHAVTPAISIRVAREIKERSLPIAFTYHTPTVSCQRGTLMRWGRSECDGVIRVHTCAACTVHGLGANRAVGLAVGALPTAVGRTLGAQGVEGGLGTALRMSDLIARRKAAFQELIESVDKIVAPCRWAADVLTRNGAPTSKVVMCRQGVASSFDARSNSSAKDRPITRLVYLGRAAPEKGLDLLIGAILGVRAANLELLINAVVQSASDEAYLARLREQAKNDPRVVFRSRIDRARLREALADVDLVAVPSRWLETGPLVVLEAFAAGIPVIGTRLGGIAELVHHEVNGLLVESPSLGAWTTALKRIDEDKGLIARLERGITPPRTMRDVGAEMRDLYSEMLGAAL